MSGTETQPGPAPEDWVGRSETLTDRLDTGPAQRLMALLDRDPDPLAAGDPLPPGGHWHYFLPRARQSALGPDGHERRGGFLPPIALPRRMWAGGRLQFHQPLILGDAAERRSTILSVVQKTGRSGPLAFVTVRHDISGPNGLAVSEEHDIVYRAQASGTMDKAPAPSTASPASARPQPAWRTTIEPTAALLFRYSALTFNGHRIHYDRAYATAEEGYPGLVVHGPLIATLLMDGWRRANPADEIARFRFRMLAPVCDTGPFVLAGARAADGTDALWAESHEGILATEAAVEPQDRRRGP
ncbi:MAG: MaoC family dehydratase N-terminal domain-containing protein [Proteobacteria bacterium]|nr:MaoC family dehydratase N-terminal domain-containing protein [Pseudomonadota bacterium]